MAHQPGSVLPTFTRNATGPQVKSGPRPGDTIDMRLLVLCPEVQDPNFVTLRMIMDYIGMRYDVLAARTADLRSDHLWQGAHARYQAIVLTTGYFAAPDTGPDAAPGDWYDPLDDSAWAALHSFQARFGIRLASFCGIPRLPITTNAVVVHDGAGMTDSPLELTLTDAGRQVFWYLAGDCRIPVYDAAAVSVTPLTVASAPLLEGADGLPYGAIWSTGEGCEYLALTVNHSPRALHSLLLGYGVLNWVTRGLFLGQRTVSLNLQIDDIFTSNLLWNEHAQTDAAGEVPRDTSGPIYRLSAGDVDAAVHWLNRVQGERNSRGLTLNFAFNGAAAAPIPVDKAAVAAFVAHRRRFGWINHGYTHRLLDDAGYAECILEIQHNQETAGTLDLMPYAGDCMVTANASGLANPSYLAAAVACGIRFLVCDTSHPGWNNPAPNQPIVSAIQPAITLIPRHPNNLFYNVAAPEAWVQQYNQLYRAFWGRNLSYQEIVDAEAAQIFHYLCAGDWDPLMFHQANLAAYDGTHSLLSDLLDAVLASYNRYYGAMPICSLGMPTIGEMMARRAAYNQARIDASLVIGSGLFLLSDRDVEVPLTGVRICSQDGAPHGAPGESSGKGSSELYGGQHLATLALKANTARSLPIWDLVGGDYC